MSRSKSSHQWLQEHENDPYVSRARAEGYRSRASYKLLEIEERYQLLRGAKRVLDLGAAPGGWCQVLRQKGAVDCSVFAIDLLPIEPIPGVTVFRGDFTEDHGLDAISAFLGDHQADLVISDMAPNLSGMKAVDLPNSAYLVELAIYCADEFLRPGGHFLAKAFEGEGIDTLRRDIRTRYTKQVNIKPKASSNRSKEIYLLGLEKKKQSK